MLDLVELPRFRRTLWLALASVVALVVVAETKHAARPRMQTPAPEPYVECVEPAAPAPALATPIELERRWLVGGSTFTSPAEVHDALGTSVVAWEPFLYTGDAQPRLAIASDIYPSSEQRTYEFAQDEHGGIWLVGGTSRTFSAKRAVTYTRDIFVLPTGASFRGAR